MIVSKDPDKPFFVHSDVLNISNDIKHIVLFFALFDMIKWYHPKMVTSGAGPPCPPKQRH